MDNFHFRFAGSSPLLRLSIQPEFVSGVDTTKECRTPEQNQTKDICKNLKSHETFLIPEDELRGKWHDDQPVLGPVGLCGGLQRQHKAKKGKDSFAHHGNLLGIPP